MTLKHGSLFSGIGMLEYGLEMSPEIKTIWQVELDPYCRVILDKWYPGVRKYGDIRQCKEEELEHVDILSGGFPCFADGTLVLTYEGFRPIEDLKVGDLVLTHLGRWKRVTSLMSREADTCRLVKGMGILPTITTDEHPYYSRVKMWTRHRYARGWGRKRRYLPPSWEEAKLLDKDRLVGQVLPPVLEDGRPEAFWWLVGRYLAEGWTVVCNGKGRVVICANLDEADELAGRIREAGYNYSRDDDKTVVKFHITRKALYDFLVSFGKYAHGKVIPGRVLSLPPAKAKALLDGYFTGDGCPCQSKSGGERSSSVSPALSLGIALLVQRAYGVVASVFVGGDRGETVIEGRTVSQRISYPVQYTGRNRLSFVEGSYGWKPIRGNVPAAGRRVHNISVEDDESYIANGAIVHNCTDISVAGRRKVGKEEWTGGLGIGTPDDPSARSGLWYEFLRLIKGIRPSWVIVENVARLCHTEDGSRVVTDLEAAGYAWGAALLGTEVFSAPHPRPRVWIVACDHDPFGDGDTGAGLGQGELPDNLEGAFAETSKNWGYWKRQLGTGDADPEHTATEPESAAYSRGVRAVYGSPYWTNRVKCCGNSVVWVVPAVIGALIVRIEKAKEERGGSISV
jgi:site-specific DNA-cytosine methylase